MSYAQIRKTLLSLLLLTVAGLSCTTVLDSQAIGLTERSLSRALLSFGTARGLNAIISVAQGTEFTMQPAGVGVVLTPGQILDPINDLIERFSWVMLLASTSLGMQKLFLDMVAWNYFTYFVGFAFLLLSIALWTIRSTSETFAWLYKLAFILLILRFGVSALAVGSEVLFSTFLEQRYQVASAELEATTQQLHALRISETSLPSNDSGMLSKAREWYSQLTENLNISTRLAHYKKIAETTSRSAIDLLVVFLFQTVVFPLVFLYSVLTFTKRYLTH